MKYTVLAMFATVSAFAQDAIEKVEKVENQAPAGSGISAFLPFILLFVVMWLFFIRPKQKEVKKQDEMRKSLKVGDKVSTFAGIIGIIHRIDDEQNTITLRTGSSTIEFQKLAIQGVINTPSEVKNDNEKKAEAAK